jgi:hypothetical protein
MIAGYNPKAVTFAVADPTKDNTYKLMRVPSKAAKIEIISAWAEIDTTITLGNGTGIALQLMNYGTAGTAVVASGTLAGTLGGTTVTWTANVPKAFTVSEGTMTAEQYLVLEYDESGTIAPLNVTVGIEYVDGVGA